MGLSGLEPPTSRLSGVRSNRLSYKPRLLDRCRDICPRSRKVRLHAGLYMPVPPVSISGRFIMTAVSWIRTAFVIFLGSGSHLLSRTVSSTVSSAARGLTFVFGMGTGVPPRRIAAGIFLHCSHTALFHCSGSSMYRLSSHTLPSSTVKQQSSPYFFP